MDKITTKLTSWTSKFLSYDGRLQLLQTVIEGIHLFWDQVFLLPKKLVMMVETKCRAFLWAGTNLESKRALVAWELVCKPKCFGGLGLRNIYVWNKLVLVK